MSAVVAFREADKSSKSMFVDDEAGVGDSEDDGGKGKGGGETEAEEEDEAVLMEEGPTEEEPEEPEEEEKHVPTAPIQVHRSGPLTRSDKARAYLTHAGCACVWHDRAPSCRRAALWTPASASWSGTWLATSCRSPWTTTT